MVKPLLHYQYLASFWPGRILCQSSRYFLKERGGGLGFYVGLNLRMTRSPKIYKIPLVTDALKMANKIKRKEYPVKRLSPYSPRLSLVITMVDLKPQAAESRSPKNNEYLGSQGNELKKPMNHCLVRLLELTPRPLELGHPVNATITRWRSVSKIAKIHWTALFKPDWMERTGGLQLARRANSK